MVIEGRSAFASLAHRYWKAGWEEARNREVYGADASVEGQGGNFRLKVFLENENSFENPELAAGLAEVKSLIDHRCLFDDLAEFRENASTLEAVTSYLSERLFRRPLASGRWHSLTVEQGEGLLCRARNGVKELELEFHIGDLHLTVCASMDPATGLVQNREKVFQVVQQTYARITKQPLENRSGWLFNQLQTQLKSVTRVEIDLTRQKSLGLIAGT